MKRLYTILVSAILVVGCSEADITDGAGSLATKGATIDINSSPSSRVAVDNSDENWSLTWCEGDALSSLLVDGEGNTSINSNTFTIAAEDISADGATAQISGDVATGAEQMILVYPASSFTATAEGYAVASPKNVVDMSEPYAHLGAIMPLVSDKIALSDGSGNYSTTMHHLSTVIEMGINFEGLDQNYNYKLINYNISTISGASLTPLNIYIDPAKSYGDEDFAYYNTSSYSGDTNIPISSCPVTNGTPVVIPIALLPFELTATDYLNIHMILEVSDKEGKNESFTIGVTENVHNTSGQTVAFEAGTYNSIKHTYDISEEVELYTPTWISKGALSFEGGDGSAESPYEIASPEQLARLAALSTNMENQELLSQHFALTKDIDISQYPWYGIIFFYGTFNGQYHTVSGINGLSTLFSSCYDATICKVNVEGELFEGEIGGSIVQAATSSKIYDCSSSIPQNCTMFAAGVVAYASQGCIITNCYNTATITSEMMAGGIVGCTDSSVTIVNCYNRADITAPNAGGVLGYAMGASDATLNIRSSYNVGEVTGGGIIGQNSSSQIILDACYSTTGDDTDANGKAMPDSNSSLATALNSSAARYNATVDTSAGDVKAWAWEATDSYPHLKTGYVPIVINAGFE